MTFEEWLVTQKNRNDPIGDLAKDFDFTRNKKCDEKHLGRWEACKEAYDALKEARKEYRDAERKRLESK
jgi:hypothetical protein